MEQQRLLTVGDLCRRLNVSRSTLDRMRAGGRVPPPLPLAGRGSRPPLRWNAAEVENWIAAGMPDAKAWAAARRMARR